ncbi:MAG TPA: YrdB family protein [Aggregatilineales bacterium]|nr:YrdB family protein [Chloroflexota bacterium]HOA24466.1 YrdB family protein [Aggregatilineales bacterium]HPV08649.1 YrdB family protein [Aggregatilineales bacterium]HQA67379.1 YrdB family protein [Aggregatilineales bacterium]
MSNAPANLALRFLLEIAALVAYGYWGWTQHEGAGRFLWAIGLPVVAAAAWGTFRVPGDPAEAPVAVPGIVRLLLETVFFAGAVMLLAAAGPRTLAIIFGVIVLAHYGLSYDRVIWLLRGAP